MPAVITPANIHSSPSRISKSPQSNASASTPASVSHASPPTPKPNKTTIQRKKWFLHERVAFICFLGFIICLICFIMGVESEDITAPVVIIWNRSSLIYCIITFLFMCLLPSPHKKEEVRPVPSSVKCLATIMIITSIVTLIMLRLNHTFNEKVVSISKRLYPYAYVEKHYGIIESLKIAPKLLFFTLSSTGFIMVPLYYGIMLLIGAGKPTKNKEKEITQKRNK